MQKKRPKYLNLIKIKLPLPGVVSIGHRVSGVLLFFPGIPLLLYGLHLMLGTPQSFDLLKAVFSNAFVKLVLLGGIWLLMHHFCAGLRYLALDLHWGIALKQARASSYAVLAGGAVLTGIIGVLIW